MQEYHWPGNVRELENIVTRGCILQPGGTIDVAYEEIDYDGSIYLVTDCNDAPGTCVAGDDCYPNPCTDLINYTNTTGGNVEYWLIVDGFTGFGLGHLSGMTGVCLTSPVEPTTWGHIKSLHK